MSTLTANSFWNLRRVGDDGQRQGHVESESTAIDARVSVYPLGDNHPLAHLFGKYADDPMWAELEVIMQQNSEEDNLNNEIE